jgi:hypothetical protein
MCYVPRGCTAECAALWLPFTNECGGFFDDILQNEGVRLAHAMSCVSASLQSQVVDWLQDGKCGFSRVEAWDTFHKECHTVQQAAEKILAVSGSPKQELSARRKCDFGGTCGGNCDGFDCH